MESDSLLLFSYCCPFPWSPAPYSLSLFSPPSFSRRIWLPPLFLVLLSFPVDPASSYLSFFVCFSTGNNVTLPLISLTSFPHRVWLPPPPPFLVYLSFTLRSGSSSLHGFFFFSFLVDSGSPALSHFSTLPYGVWLPPPFLFSLSE